MNHLVNRWLVVNSTSLTLRGGIDESHSQEALSIITAHPDATARDRMTRILAHGIAERDLSGAVAWMSSLAEAPVRQRAWEGIEETWVQQDPEAAAVFALSSIPAGKSRINALAAVARGWVRSGWDEQAAIKWADRVPAGPERDAFLSALAGK